jgi:hypothetical protein
MTPPQLRAVARASKDARQVRRLPALAGVNDVASGATLPRWAGWIGKSFTTRCGSTRWVASRPRGAGSQAEAARILKDFGSRRCSAPPKHRAQNPHALEAFGEIFPLRMREIRRRLPAGTPLEGKRSSGPT